MLQEDIVKTTCPRDCYDACGLAVYKENGVITKVLGDPGHPISRGKLCSKCAIAYNGAWRDETLRLTAPCGVSAQRAPQPSPRSPGTRL